ncbi:MAG: OsmC family protein [Acidobacteria bacterium]|nr:OsmC family protein [Acidobacteriota bacterium]MBS1864514.1 OsmC family protein [Acidobacteriota bacterium]
MENQLACRVTAAWESGRKGTVAAPGIEPKIRFSSPPEFKGDPGFWTPEHFLLAAVASCFVVTFYALADRSRMEFGKLDLSVEGRLGMFEGRLSFREIILQPTLTILQAQDRDRAYALLERTEHGCLIARSLACPVMMEPLVKSPEEILAT